MMPEGLVKISSDLYNTVLRAPAKERRIAHAPASRTRLHRARACVALTTKREARAAQLWWRHRSARKSKASMPHNRPTTSAAAHPARA